MHAVNSLGNLARGRECRDAASIKQIYALCCTCWKIWSCFIIKHNQYEATMWICRWLPATKLKCLFESNMKCIRVWPRSAAWLRRWVRRRDCYWRMKHRKKKKRELKVLCKGRKIIELVHLCFALNEVRQMNTTTSPLPKFSQCSMAYLKKAETFMI